MNHKDWDFVNRQLVAKCWPSWSMSRFSTRNLRAMAATALTCRAHNGASALNAASGAGCGLMLKRCADEPVLAQTLLMQLKPVLSMSDATVAEHMQDLYATLLGDLQLLKARRGLSASDLIDLDADRLQCLLSGHPKFALIKVVGAGAKRRWSDMRQSTPTPSDCTGWR